MEEAQAKGKNSFIETVKSLGVALLIALALRAFVIEPFKIPSASMFPTLLEGDHIFVNKFVFGLRIPWTKIRFWNGRNPERGEVIVFYPPHEPKNHYIKRVVGIPGDKIHISETELWVNGAKVLTEAINLTPDAGRPTRLLASAPMIDSHLNTYPGWEQYQYFNETLGTQKHVVQYKKASDREEYDIVVPPGFYFMMGDNRDNSMDSRVWGFLPRKNVMGKAMFIWLSFEFRPFEFRLDRFGRGIY